VQGHAAEHLDQAETHGHRADTEGQDAGEERGAKERAVHDHGAHRVFTVELGVGLATGGVKGVLVDDLGLGVGAERAVDVVAGEERGVLRDDDVLRGELVLDEHPGARAADEHDRADDRDDDAGELDESATLRGNRFGLTGCAAHVRSCPSGVAGSCSSGTTHSPTSRSS